MAKPSLAIGRRSGVPGIIDYLADEPAGETPELPYVKQSESISDMIHRSQAELQKKIDKIMGKTVTPPVPTTPPGMRRQKGYNSPK